MINYEFPLSERIRTLLRLEGLYTKISHFIAQSSTTDHQAALNILFEILEVTGRSDLKPDLIQELERQKRQLTTLYDNPEISKAALDTLLSEIESTSTQLLSIGGRPGQQLRDNEWLMGIKQRTGIPGGTCEFDLPSFHYWLSQDVALRHAYLQDCLAPLLPIRDALTIVLKLLRDNGKLFHFTATQGCFQQPQGGRVAQMLCVSLNNALQCVPEVSANKYVLNIRFVLANYSVKSAAYEQDVKFDLTFCYL